MSQVGRIATWSVWAALLSIVAGAAYVAATAEASPGAALLSGSVCVPGAPPPQEGGASPGLLDTGGFPARWWCGAWPRALGWMHIVSDVLVWGAYMAIPLVLYVFVRGRRDLPFPSVFWFFMAFIASCGLGHLVEASMFWWPGYRLSAVVKVATAVVSWVTVVALIPLVPKALSLPRLERDNEVLRRTLEEQERMRKDVAKANAMLERRSDEMEQLLYAVSHDLKAPVFTIVSMLSLAERARERGAASEEAAMLEKVKSASERLRGSLESLVEFGRAGHWTGAWSAVDLNAVADAAVTAVAGAIASSEATVRVAPGLPTIEGDERSLTQAVQNLVGNAIKHGHRGRRPRVWIDCEQGDGVVRLRVEDDGPGVPATQRERVFELFVRLAGGEVEGTGIGLAMVRQVARLHGGRVWVEDRDGGGARFVLELPVSQRGGGSEER